MSDSPFTNKNPVYSGLKIGDYTYGAPELLYWDADSSIGKFCSIAKDVYIFFGGGWGAQI